MVDLQWWWWCWLGMTADGDSNDAGCCRWWFSWPTCPTSSAPTKVTATPTAMNASVAAALGWPLPCAKCTRRRNSLSWRMHGMGPHRKTTSGTNWRDGWAGGKVFLVVVFPRHTLPPFHNWELKGIPRKEAGWPKSIEHKQAFPFECPLQTPIPSDWDASICFGVACSWFWLPCPTSKSGQESTVWFAETAQHSGEVWDFLIKRAQNFTTASVHLSGIWLRHQSLVCSQQCLWKQTKECLRCCCLFVC